MTLDTGSKFKVEKGCKTLGFVKGQRGVVKELKPMGSEHNYNVRILVEINGGSMVLWATGIARLGAPVIRLSRGPMEYIDIISLS